MSYLKEKKSLLRVGHILLNKRALVGGADMDKLCAVKLFIWFFMSLLDL